MCLVRGPPMKSRREAFVDQVLSYAADDSHGYSQKPPSGRWGPDYDCSSLLYQAAQDAGYNVGTGSDKVRFTGTMLKDFEKAGFQILPFANVGISDLEVGDILLNLALHAEVYVGNNESVGATGSETGGFVGKAGDQTGREIERHPVTTFDKDWDYILRPPAEQEESEEGDKDVPMNYNQPGQGLNGMYSPTTYNPSGWPQAAPMGYAPGNNGYPQGTRWGTNTPGYPQGNLGQMNGYSQANAGYPQGMDADLCFVMGIEGAKNISGTPNTRKAVFDEDKPLMYVVGFGPQGTVNDIHVYRFEECSEEMPQHLSPLMKQNMMPMGGSLGQQDYITRDEFEQLKEMLTDGQSTNASSEPSSSRGTTQQSATAGRPR